MDIRKYLDSTYLKLPSQSGLSEEQTFEKVKELVEEAIDHQFYLVMVRPQHVKWVKDRVSLVNSSIKIGAVIGFHEGTYPINEKLEEAERAIADGADELDFVINYEAFKKEDTEYVKDEFMQGTSFVLGRGKVIKWIIETAALTDEEIKLLCIQLSSWSEEKFEDSDRKNIFIKSSTGFYETEEGKPNGATFHSIEIMVKNSVLPVKASGGVKNYKDAVRMIEMGVKRIGTSSAKFLAEQIR